MALTSRPKPVNWPFSSSRRGCPPRARPRLSRLLRVERLEDRTLFSVRLVSDIVPGPVGSNPTFLMNGDGYVVFSAVNPQTNQRGLWRSDGTEQGTVLIQEGLSPAKTNSAIDFSPEVAVRFGPNNDRWKSLLFFAADDGTHGTEPWISDGTPGGTRLVQDINQGPPSSNPDFRTVVNGRVYFAAADHGVNRRLWRTVTANDGTVTAERAPGVPVNLILSSENFLMSINGNVYFAADDGLTGDELWVYDTTTEQTTQVKDINPGPFGSNPLELTNVNGTLYFTADDGSSPGGTELWKSDGTGAGTVKVGHFNLANMPDFVENLTYANGSLFFAAEDGQNEDLMKFDAQANDLSVLHIFISTPRNFTDANGQLYFTVFNSMTGTELWTSDGTPAGTVQVQNIPANSFPQHLTAVGNTLFFSADDGINGRELWQTIQQPDGTIAAELVADINPGAASSDPQFLVNVNGRLFFSADDGTHGRELWTVDTHQPAGKAFATVTVNVPLEDARSQNQDNDTQSETTLEVFGSTVLVGFNDTGAMGNHGIGFSRSTNGGATFVDTETLPPSGNGDSFDPSLARDNTSGTIYLSTLDQFGSSGNTLPVFRSFDAGATFQAPVEGVQDVPAGEGLDKDWITVDNFPGLGQGNVYLVVRHLLTPPTAPGEIRLTRSTDGGATFGPSGGTEIVPAGNGNVQGAWVTVGPDHTGYVFWYQSDDDGGTTNPRIMVSKSMDRGQTFGARVLVTMLHTSDVNGNLGLVDDKNQPFRTVTYPQVAVNPVNGHLYVVYNDNPNTGGADKADIFFRFSTDGGANWSDPVRVNDDTGDLDTNDQWHPVLAVTPDGTKVGVFWYDRRLDPSNNLIDRFGAIGTVSSGGVAFGANFAVTNISFPPVFNQDPALGATYMGDYDQAVADNSFFYTTWGDNSGRNLVGSASIADTRFQADVRFAKIPVGLAPAAHTARFLPDLRGSRLAKWTVVGSSTTRAGLPAIGQSSSHSPDLTIGLLPQGPGSFSNLGAFSQSVAGLTNVNGAMFFMVSDWTNRDARDSRYEGSSSSQPPAVLAPLDAASIDQFFAPTQEAERFSRSKQGALLSTDDCWADIVRSSVPFVRTGAGLRTSFHELALRINEVLQLE